MKKAAVYDRESGVDGRALFNETKHPGFAGHIGVARADITPPAGIFRRTWGAAKNSTAAGVHRSLTLTILTLQDGLESEPLVLVDTDLGWWGSISFERRFRKRVLDELKLSAEQYMFSCTQTHSVPPICAPEPEWQGGEILAAYVERVFSAVIETARQALATAQPATLEWHTGYCALASNRDLPQGNRVVCGFNPAIAADDTLLVGRVATASGKIIATVVDYACHPTTLGWDNELVSPDYVGAMRETIQQNTGGAPALFLQGASGELAPRYQYVGDTAVADAHGRELGYAALTTLAAMQPVGNELVFDRVVESGAPLAVWKHQPRALSRKLRALLQIVELPLKDLPVAAELKRQYETSTDHTMKERLRRKLRLREGLGDGATFPLELWGWRVGEAVIVGSAAEPYSWLQQHVRERFPANAIAWINCLNGAIGYLPPADAYNKDMYQVWQSPFARGSLEALESAVARLVEELLSL
jgi:hypothetical protein